MKINIIAPDDPALAVASETIRMHPEWNADLTIIPWADYRDVLMDSLTSEISPRQAVFIPGHVWIPELAHKGLILPLEPLIGKLPQSTWKAYSTGDILERVALESCFQDQQFMIPTFNDGHLLFYRSDLLKLDDSQGVPVISPFELLEFAAKLHHPPEIFGLALKAHPSEILFDWLPFLFEAGGRVLDDSLQPAFATAEGIRALEYYCQLRTYSPAETHTYGNAEIANILRNGQAALVTTWGGQAAPIFLDEQNLYRHMYGSAIYHHPCGGTWGIAIPSNQPEDLKLKSLEIALEINGPAQDLEIIVKAGSPVRKSSYSNENLMKYSWLKAQYEMLNRVSWLPVLPRTAFILGPLSEALYLAFTGELGPKESLERADQQVKELILGTSLSVP